MRKHLILTAVVLSLCVACGDSPEAPTDAAPMHAAEMVFRVEGPVASLDGILEITNARLAALGAGRAEAVPGDPPRIRCLVDAPWHLDPGAVEAVVSRRGTLELRIVASENVARAEREARLADGDAYRPADPAYRWVARSTPASGGAADVLVVLPEQRLVAQIRRTIAEEGAAAREVLDDLRAQLDGVRLSDVFGEQDISSADVQNADGGGNPSVAFELAEDRQQAFEDFTSRHTGNQMAIIVDGIVHSTPVIVSPLPGRAIIEGGGAAGFTPQEAAELAAVLSARRALPATLVRESFDVVQ